MKRTQLYIDEDLFQWLTLVSLEKQTTISDLVRKALTKVYGHKKKKNDFSKALNSAFGIWKKRKDIPSAEEYVREARKDSRSKRLGLE